MIDGICTVREDTRQVTGFWASSGFKTAESRNVVCLWDQLKDRPTQAGNCGSRGLSLAKCDTLWTLDKALETEKRKSLNTVPMGK